LQDQDTRFFASPLVAKKPSGSRQKRGIVTSFARCIQIQRPGNMDKRPDLLDGSPSPSSATELPLMIKNALDKLKQN
jgi:hypothetical protein